jgi:Mrp family chromosome partitioning ATPase
MSEMSEHLTTEKVLKRNNAMDSGQLPVEGRVESSTEKTQKLQIAKNKELLPEVETSLAVPQVAYTKKTSHPKRQAVKVNKRDEANIRMLWDQCRQLCLALFFRADHPVRSLGFTSSIEGEGKTFIARTAARVLAHDSNNPVVLVDCNWEHPSLNELFDIPSKPGLAEWLRGACDEEDIRYQVDHNLTVIPAGNGSQDAVKLLKQVQLHSLLTLFKRMDELFIVDLPPILTTGYGTLAAGMLESIVVVARAQAVPDDMIAETCKQLKDLPVHGIILNREQSRIPDWIRQIL